MSQDTYNNYGQAGAVGANSHVHDINFMQVGSQIENSIDLSLLVNELSMLRKAMKKSATELEHDIAISEVAKAEQAAQGKDSRKLAESLKSAGNWALDIATKIGTSLAVEAIKQSLKS